MRYTSLSILCAIGICGALCAVADTGEPSPVLETKVKHLALFKNGYALLSCEGKLEPGADRVYLDRVPRAVLGTLWFGTGKDAVRIRDVKVVQRTTTYERPAMSFEELIRVNPGRQICLKTDAEIVGTLLPVPDEIRRDEPGSFPLPGVEVRHSYIPPTSHVRGPAPLRPDFFMLQGEQGACTAVPFTSIRELRFLKEAATVFPEQIEKPFLECALDGPAQDGALYLHYLQGGASWMPAYEIDLDDEEEATVRLKATLINDIEDLENVEVRCVVGFPNFMFAQHEDPMSGRHTLHEFLDALYRGESDRSSSRRGMMTQQVMSNVFQYDHSVETPPLPAVPEGGEFKEDLFFYPPIETTLKRGERAAFVLSEDRAPYEHIYTWDIPDTIFLDRSGYSRGQPEQEPETEEIWHCLRLTNDSGRPWTTAAAFIVRDQLPLGQDMLRYTSVGAKTRVRITRATDVAGDCKEFEVERTQGARRIYGSDYDLVTVRGELKVQNKRNEPVRVIVVKTTTGVVKESSHDPKIELRAEGLRPINPRSTLRWERELEPGAEETLTYVIEVYVRT